MPSSLRSLADRPPSGRSRPLLIDAEAYALAVIRQGRPVVRTDPAALAGYVAQIQALLGPDAVWLDVDALYTAHLAGRPALVADLGARTRPGYPLRTLLADGGGVDRVVTTVRTLAETTRRPVVLDVPSPARWLARAHTLAGKPVDVLDADDADRASMYVAQWLGLLGGLPLALVLLDSREREGEAAMVAPDSLADYSSIANIVGHCGWGLARRTSDGVEVPAGEASVGTLPPDYWTDGHGDAPRTGDVLLTTIPPTATPEHVLARLALLT